MKNITALTLITLVLSGCGTMTEGTSSGSYQKDFDALKKVEAEDGISQSEAHTIANAFFWSNISGCGFPEEPISENNHWVSQTHVGYAGLPGGPIYIDKKTGAITCGNKTITLEELRKQTSNWPPVSSE